MALIDQLQIERANYDILGVINRYVTLKKTGKNWSACCPFHKEKSPSFTVNEDKGMFWCFGCGAGGDAVKFVMEHDGLSFPAAIEAINGNLSPSITPEMVRKRATQDHTAKPSDHTENPEQAKTLLAKCTESETHMHLLRNNTASYDTVKILKDSLIVDLYNQGGELINLAAIQADGSIKYSAGGISYGAVATIEPVGAHDGTVILTMDYAEAWRLWWMRKGCARIICSLSFENCKFIADKQRERFTHIGCSAEIAEDFLDYGHEVFLIPAAYQVKVA
jgi:phage/plasmid primase-like uncharacterized protein